jgi:RNA ligase (TIGR02306 family)
MSKTFVSVERVLEVKDHPQADRLDLIKVLGYEVITQKGSFQVGDLVVYFPPDMKHAVFPGATDKTKCRVGAARIRGVPSHGFCSPTTTNCRVPAGIAEGTDVSHLYDAHKYVAPVHMNAGDAAPPLEVFHKYTDIENIQRFPDAFCEDEQVAITEKIHGTSCRLGLVRDDGEYIFVAGSHTYAAWLASRGPDS